MIALLENIEFWKAIATMLWPIFALVVFLSAKSKIYAFLGKDNLSIKVGGMEISVADAAKSLGASVSDLQKRLADLERKSGSTESGPRPQTTAEATNPDAKVSRSIARASRDFSVLWVDDYPSNNAFLIEQFQKDGIQVKLALSTAEALKDLQNGQFNVVITDLGRKEAGMDNPFAGLELIQQIRNSDKEIPILVFAGERGLRNEERLLDAGASTVTASFVEIQSFVTRARSERNISSVTPATS